MHHEHVTRGAGPGAKRLKVTHSQCPCHCHYSGTGNRHKWLAMDTEVYDRWCRFASELRLTPRQLVPVLLEVAKGVSSLALRLQSSRGRYES